MAFSAYSIPRVGTSGSQVARPTSLVGDNRLRMPALAQGQPGMAPTQPGMFPQAGSGFPTLGQATGQPGTLPGVNLPKPYPNAVVNDATRLARARAAQMGNLPYLMKQYAAPGVSYSSATLGMAMPDAVAARAAGEQEVSNLGLQARQANAQQRLFGQGLGFDQALAQQSGQADLNEMVRQFTRQNQGLLIDALLRGGQDAWGMF